MQFVHFQTKLTSSSQSFYLHIHTGAYSCIVYNWDLFVSKWMSDRTEMDRACTLWWFGFSSKLVGLQFFIIFLMLLLFTFLVSAAHSLPSFVSLCLYICFICGIEALVCSGGVTAVISVVGVAVVLCHWQSCWGCVPLVASVVTIGEVPGTPGPSMTQVRMKDICGAVKSWLFAFGLPIVYILLHTQTKYLAAFVMHLW